MVNQQKGVQQDTAVVVNDHMYPRPCLQHFSYESLLGQKRYRDGDTFTTTAL